MQVYKTLDAVGYLADRDVAPTLDATFAADGPDFLRDDLFTAALDLLLAARSVSYLAPAEALLEPAARVRRVRAALEVLSEQLPD